MPSIVTEPSVRPAKVNPPVISAANPMRDNAPTIAISVSAWTIAGIFMFRILFDNIPENESDYGCKNKSDDWSEDTKSGREQQAITPDPKAIILPKAHPYRYHNCIIP